MNAPAATVPTLLMIDVEPDQSAPARRAPDPWLGFEAWAERAKPLREQLERATGRPVHFNWFLRMDPQITELCGDPAWVADRYGRQLDELRSAGDELGVHPHAWRWQDPPGRWLQDLDDAGFIETCTQTSFEAYERAFGARCLTHRSGTRFMSARVVRQIAELGVRVDLTVEPGALPKASLSPRLASTGSLPDARQAPRRPYRPSSSDPMRVNPNDHRPAGEGLWMLPVSSFDPAPTLSRARQFVRRIRFVGQPRHRPAELWSPIDASVFWRLLELSLDEAPRPYLCLPVRSDALINPTQVGAVNAKLDALQNLQMTGRLSFMTATETLDQLTTL